MKPPRIAEWVWSLRLRLVRPLRIRMAGLTRARARGRFVAVTGSSAKSTTTMLIAAILDDEGNVLNQVFENTINPLIRTIRRSRIADFVVVETGVGGKGQMSTMAGLLKPDVSVVTMVGLEHYSAFRSREAIATEKGALVAATAPDGLAVLNADDPLTMGMAERTPARIVTFGHGSQADCRILRVTGDAQEGVTVHLAWRGQEIAVKTQFAGAHFAIPVAAAAVTGLELGVPPERIRTAIAGCAPPFLRLSRHHIAGGPVFLADCAKAPQGTLHLAFDALGRTPAPRRRIVLGTISDYRGNRRRAYRNAIEQALLVADEVILLSEPGYGFDYLRDRSAERRVKVFAEIRDASIYIAGTAVKDEVILLKGSQSNHLERILLAQTEGVNCWERACGKGIGCVECGLFGHDFARHRATGRRSRLRRLTGRAMQGGKGVA